MNTGVGEMECAAILFPELNILDSVIENAMICANLGDLAYDFFLFLRRVFQAIVRGSQIIIKATDSSQLP